MILVSTFNKGGVGKTTLAVHIAALLGERTDGRRTLLVDCVDQHDAFTFFTREAPTKELEPIRISDSLAVTWNPDRAPLRKEIEHHEYDHIVIDLNSPQVDTVRTILQDDPDRLLLPINDQALADARIAETFEVLHRMQDRFGALFDVLLVPLGRRKGEVYATVAPLTIKPAGVGFSTYFRKASAEFRRALTSGIPIWHQDGCEGFRGHFQRLLG